MSTYARQHEAAKRFFIVVEWRTGSYEGQRCLTAQEWKHGHDSYCAPKHRAGITDKGFLRAIHLRDGEKPAKVGNLASLRGSTTKQQVRVITMEKKGLGWTTQVWPESTEPHTGTNISVVGCQMTVTITKRFLEAFIQCKRKLNKPATERNSRKETAS